MNDNRLADFEPGDRVTANRMQGKPVGTVVFLTSSQVAVRLDDDGNGGLRYWYPGDLSHLGKPIRMTAPVEDAAPADPVTTAVNLLGGPSPDLDVAKVAALVALIRGEEAPPVVELATQPAVEGTWDPTNRSVKAVGRRVRARARVADPRHGWAIEEQHCGRTGRVADDDRAVDDSLYIEWDQGGHWWTNPADLIGID